MLLLRFFHNINQLFPNRNHCILVYSQLRIHCEEHNRKLRHSSIDSEWFGLYCKIIGIMLGNVNLLFQLSRLFDNKFLQSLNSSKFTQLN